MNFIKINLILIVFYVLFLPKLSLGARPFVTEYANTAKEFQLDTVFWINSLSTRNNSSLSQFTYVGIGLRDWLEIAGVSGSGYDFSKKERTSSNPTFKTKLRLLEADDCLLPYISLIGGINFRTGSGSALYDDAQSYFYMISLSKNFLDDIFTFSFNLGRRFKNERLEDGNSHIYWAYKLDTKLPRNFGISLETFRGDIFQARNTNTSFQGGLTYELKENIKFNLLSGFQRESIISDNNQNNLSEMNSKRLNYWINFGVAIVFDLPKIIRK